MNTWSKSLAFLEFLLILLIYGVKNFIKKYKIADLTRKNLENGVFPIKNGATQNFSKKTVFSQFLFLFFTFSHLDLIINH